MVIWFVDSANVFITAEVKKVQKKKSAIRLNVSLLESAK